MPPDQVSAGCPGSRECQVKMKASLIGRFVPWVEAWIGPHETLAWWLGVSSVIIFLATLISVMAVTVMLPSDHFLHHHQNHPAAPLKNPVLFVCYQVCKNLVGVSFIVAGPAMLVLPGQGLIALIIGLSLISFPGKRRVIRSVVRRKAVLRSANWLRAKFNRPPLQAPS
jgi:hypothetical protein